MNRPNIMCMPLPPAAFLMFAIVLAPHGVASGTVLPATVLPAPADSAQSNANVGTLMSAPVIGNNGAPLGSRVYFGTLNINGHDLIVTATNETTALSNYATVVDELRSGFDDGDWLGTGITSSYAVLDHSEGYNSLALGVVLNANNLGQPIWTTWDGVSVNQYDVLVKYTFYGDLDLAGSVTQADVSQVAADVGTGQAWSNGQFFYTGSPATEGDLAAANQSFYLQGDYPLTVPAGPIPPVPPVPEPASVLLAAMAIGCLASGLVR
jgi:hypothetical protein